MKWTLKERVHDIYTEIEDMETELEDKDAENADLRSENDDLQDTIKEYEETDQGELIAQINHRIQIMNSSPAAPSIHDQEREEVNKLLQAFLTGCGVDIPVSFAVYQ